VLLGSCQLLSRIPTFRLNDGAGWFGGRARLRREFLGDVSGRTDPVRPSRGARHALSGQWAEKGRLSNQA